MEQQERKRRQMLNKEIKAFSEKIAEAASQSVRIPLVACYTCSDKHSSSANLSNSMCLSVNFLSKVYHSELACAYSRQPTVWSTFQTRHSSWSHSMRSRLLPWSVCNTVFGSSILSSSSKTSPKRRCTSIPSPVPRRTMSRIGWSAYNNILFGRDDEANLSSSVDIPMAEGPVNLNWGPIMKHINESPYEFFQGGGWSFLGTGNGAQVRGFVLICGCLPIILCAE